MSCSAEESIRRRELTKGVKRGNIERVKGILESEKGEERRKLSVRACFEALNQAVKTNQQDIGLLLLDHAEKVIHDDDLRDEIWNHRILENATEQCMVLLVQRLICKVDIARYNEDPLVCPLGRAAIEGHLELVEALLAAGFSTYGLLDFSAIHEIYDENSDNDADTNLIHGVIFFNHMDEEDKRVWRLILPHVNVMEVFNSHLIDDSIMEKKGADLLHTLEHLGMDFNPLISTSQLPVRRKLFDAIKSYDVATVRFIVDHGFDVNITVQGNSETALHYLLRYLKPGRPGLDMAMMLIQAGACFKMKNDDGFNVEELCLHKLKTVPYGRVSAYGNVLRLLHRIGCILTEKSKNFIHVNCYNARYVCLNGLSREITQVPSLQSLSSHVFRSKEKSHLRDCLKGMAGDVLPSLLKDFILLKNFNWDGFSIPIATSENASDDDSDDDYDVEEDDNSNYDDYVEEYQSDDDDFYG